MSFAILGGILLNIGAYLTYKGRIYQAVIIYIFADLCWIVLAYENSDYIFVRHLKLSIWCRLKLIIQLTQK